MRRKATSITSWSASSRSSGDHSKRLQYAVSAVRSRFKPLRMRRDEFTYVEHVWRRPMLYKNPETRRARAATMRVMLRAYPPPVVTGSVWVALRCGPAKTSAG